MVRISVPIYQAEEKYWQEQLNKYRRVRSLTVYTMMFSGFKHWQEDISFEEILNVVSYPETTLVYKVAVQFDEEDEMYKTIKKLKIEQGLPMSKSARFFMFYDWRYRR